MILVVKGMMEIERTIIEYFEINDGEMFGLQEVNPNDGEISHQIIMTRQVALEMAEDIFRMLDNG